MNQPRDPAELSRLSRRVIELRTEHRDLDGAIERLQADIQADELALKRLKKRKLQLKDQIAWIENALIPDEPGLTRCSPIPSCPAPRPAAQGSPRWCGCCPG